MKEWRSLAHTKWECKYHIVIIPIHMCISVQPKHSLAMVIGYLKGKSAIRIHQEIPGVTKELTNKNFWTRGYCVSTVGLNEQQIREYIKNQEYLDNGKQGELNLDGAQILWGCPKRKDSPYYFYRQILKT